MTVTPGKDGEPWEGTPTEPYTPDQASPRGFPSVGGPAGAALEPPRLASAEPVKGGFPNARWIIALLATVAVVAVIGAVILLAGPRPAAAPLLPQYAPADVTAYAELRLDVPGDQRDRLVSFMSHFPGFEDPASFEQKINDTLEQLSQRSGGQFSWQRDVEPWFGGQVGLVLTELTAGEGMTPALTVAFSVKDRTRLDQLIAVGGMTGMASQLYRGTTVYTGTINSNPISAAVTDDALLVALRVEDIQAALDVKAGERPSLAADPAFSEQMARLDADRLGAMYFNGAKLAESLRELMGDMPVGLLDEQLAALSSTVVVQLRVEDDRLALTSHIQPAPGASGQPLPANKSTALAQRSPADTIVYVEVHETGKVVKRAIEQILALMTTDGASPVPPNIEQFLGTPPEDFLDFLDDAAISITAAGSRYGGGLIATVTDEQVAVQRLERIVSSLRALAAFGGEVPLTITDVQHGEVTVTVFALQMPDAGLPFSSISYAISDGQLILGFDGFVTDALDRTPESSLASAPAFTAALTAAGAEHAGLTYVDISRLRVLFEDFIPAEQKAMYELEVQPFVLPFTQLLMVNTSEGNTTTNSILLFVE